MSIGKTIVLLMILYIFAWILTVRVSTCEDGQYGNTQVKTINVPTEDEGTNQ